MKNHLGRLSFLALALIISISASAQQRDSKKAVWVDMDGVSVPLPPMEHPRRRSEGKGQRIPLLCKDARNHIEGAASSTGLPCPR